MSTTPSSTGSSSSLLLLLLLPACCRVIALNSTPAPTAIAAAVASNAVFWFTLKLWKLYYNLWSMQHLTHPFRTGGWEAIVYVWPTSKTTQKARHLMPSKTCMSTMQKIRIIYLSSENAVWVFILSSDEASHIAVELGAPLPRESSSLSRQSSHPSRCLLAVPSSSSSSAPPAILHSRKFSKILRVRSLFGLLELRNAHWTIISSTWVFLIFSNWT